MRPRWRLTGRRRPTPHPSGPERQRRMAGSDFLASRGMGDPGPRAAWPAWGGPQGKKVATRRCGIGGRGEAGLRPDRATEEAVRERSTDRKDGKRRRPLCFSQWLSAGVQAATPAQRLAKIRQLCDGNSILDHRASENEHIDSGIAPIRRGVLGISTSGRRALDIEGGAIVF